MTTPTEQPDALRLAKGLRDGTLLLSERDEAAEWLERLHAEREADRALMREALEVFERCAKGIDHLAEIARLWEPDHSSGADRRGWVLAQDAADDARAAISKLRARVG